MRLETGTQDGWHWAMIGLSENMNGWEHANVAVWCRKTFGLPYSREEDNAQTRWRDQLYDGVVYFRDEADRTLFLMRWGN